MDTAFFLEHLVNERNLAPNTQRSYRETFCLLIPFAAEQLQRKVDKIKVTEISAALVRKFLTYLKEVRHRGTNTHNQRLAAIHALAVFVANRSPEHLVWCSEVRAVPFKKSARTVVHYLDKLELDAMLAAAKQRELTAQGRRDYGMLLFLYNTGARADEAARLTIADLHLTPADWNGQAYVQIRGKGGRTRQCPLWPATVHEIENSIGKRQPHEHVFLTRLLRPYTRVGVYELVKRYGQRAALAVPSIATKQVSPHIIRHSTAMHLLRAGVDINTIRGWLGHVSLSTTNIYAEIDLEMKALAKCEVSEEPSATPALAGSAIFDGVPTDLVALPRRNVMWSLTRAGCDTTSSAPHNHKGQLTISAYHPTPARSQGIGSPREKPTSCRLASIVTRTSDNGRVPRPSIVISI